MVVSGLSCLIDLLGLRCGDGSGCRAGSGVVARGGGEAARRDIAEDRVLLGGGGDVSLGGCDEGAGVIKREEDDPKAQNHLRSFFDLSLFQKTLGAFSQRRQGNLKIEVANSKSPQRHK